RTRKIFRQFARDLRQNRMLSRQDARVEALLQSFERPLESPPVEKVEKMQAAVVRQREHRAQRFFQPLRVQYGDVACARGRGPDDAGEGLAKSAAGFEALVEL